MLSVLDFCSGGGGEFLGLESAGLAAAAAVDNDRVACRTLRRNRPDLRVIEDDLRNVSGVDFRGVDLLAGGVPCPPFSVAGKQLGAEDERDLFPEAVRLIRQARPSAVMLENVPGFASSRFDVYRAHLIAQIERLDYVVEWRVLLASQFGVPQLRPRFILVALKRRYASRFYWPEPSAKRVTVGQTLSDLIVERGWPGAEPWIARAAGIAPTLVGGSKKHGGPDLGPTRAKREWERLGVDGLGIADHAPAPDFPIDGRPKLTVRMTARIQGFPDEWRFDGGKTAAYRQIGNALPPPVAQAVGVAIQAALTGSANSRRPRRPHAILQPELLSCEVSIGVAGV